MPTVLLIDDEPYVLEMLATEMKERGIEYRCASDGNEALALIEKERPAVIVSDYKMPGLNGIELLRFLRNLKTNVPVIWVTGNADDETMREAWRLGVYHLFQKPFEPEEIADEVANALQITPELWLRLQPKFLTEAYVDKHIQKIQLELDKNLYQALKEHCLKKSISLNSYINDLLRTSLK